MSVNPAVRAALRAYAQDPQRLRALLRATPALKDAVVGNDGDSLLMAAIDHLDLFDYLLAMRPPPNVGYVAPNGRTILHVAAEITVGPVARRHRDEQFRRMLGMAARVPGLINAGAGKRYGTVLHTLARTSDAVRTRLAIAHGALLDARDSSGGTPLHEAAQRNSADVAEVLLEAGADANALNNTGATPLYVAAAEHARVFDVLRPHTAIELRGAAEERARQFSAAAPSAPQTQLSHIARLLTE